MPRAFYVKESIHNFLVYVLVCFVARYKAIFVKFYSLSTLLCIRYSTIETKEFVRIGYNGFLLRICTQMKAEVSSRPSPEYECRKRNPLYPIRANYFVSAFTWVRMRKKKPVISNTDKLFCFRLHLSTNVEKETRYIQYGQILFLRPSPEYECGTRNPLYPIRAICFCFGLHLSTNAEKETRYIQYGQILLFRPSPEYECGKRNPLYPIRANSFASIIMYLTCIIIVLLKK